MKLRFDEQVAIVTGAGKGLGREYALQLAARGARVLVNNRAHAGDPVRSADSTVAAIVAGGGAAVANYASVEDEDAPQEMLRQALAAWGRVDIVIHNAGIARSGFFTRMSATDFAALMRINPIYVFSHDSVGVGEDGPTHQPIEQTATLRMMPNLDVWRPCDSVETFVAWQIAIEHRTTPTALILTRQNLPHQPRDAEQIKAIRRGGYVLTEAVGTPQAVIIATGSEVSLAVAAQKSLAEKSFPCLRASFLSSRRRLTATRYCRVVCRALPSKRASPATGASTSDWKVP